MALEQWFSYNDRHRNTLGDMLALQGGIKNVDRYFNPMTPETEQQLNTTATSNKHKQKTNKCLKLKHLYKQNNTKLIRKLKWICLKLQIDAQKAIAVDDRERDRWIQDLINLKMQLRNTGKYGTK